MKLVNLDNEVYFKKVFTDKEVFMAFVKDITGITIEVDKIETEKQLERKVAPIKFKLDIFAESIDHRVIIEIQKVDYDYNFDRFMHYFLASLIDLQRSSDDYAFEKEVYTIIVITAPYLMDKKTGKILKDDVLVSNLNPRTLQNLEREIYGHKLIFLNSNCITIETPQNYLDWLRLIDESINNPENPRINLANPAIKKASELANLDNVSAEELEQAKNEVTKRKALIAYEEHFKMEKTIEGIKKALKRGKLTLEEIAEDFEVPLEMVLGLKNDL